MNRPNIKNLQDDINTVRKHAFDAELGVIKLGNRIDSLVTWLAILTFILSVDLAAHLTAYVASHWCK